MYIVYAIENRGNGKIYVGQTKAKEARWYDHRRYLRKGKHHCHHLQNAWNAYGEAAFDFYVIDAYGTPEDQTDAEAFFITWYRDLGLSYNVYGGDNSVYTRNPESRKRSSQSWTDERRREQSEARKGRQSTPMTNEIRAKISAALAGRKNGPRSEETRAKIRAANTGRAVTEEARAKMSAARMGVKPWNAGQPMSEESRKKVSKSRKGKGTGPRSEETRRKLSENKKAYYARLKGTS